MGRSGGLPLINCGMASSPTSVKSLASKRRPEPRGCDLGPALDLDFSFSRPTQAVSDTLSRHTVSRLSIAHITRTK